MTDTAEHMGIEVPIRENERANQHPLNLYGDETEFKFLPNIGDTVNASDILYAFRPVNTETFISDEDVVDHEQHF